MKTKVFSLSILLLLSLGFGMQAQNRKMEHPRVQLSREVYPQRLEHIAYVKEFESDGTPNVNYLTTVRQQNWAGSGQSVDRVEYYYKEIEEECEPNPLGYILLMVRRTYNMGSQNVFEEFVYDDDGYPLFWYTKYGFEGEEQSELRGYYDVDGSLVKSLVKQGKGSGEVDAVYDNARKSFSLFRQAFDALYQIEYVR